MPSMVRKPAAMRNMGAVPSDTGCDDYCSALGRCLSTSSIRPKFNASSADRKVSRSIALSASEHIQV